MKDIREELEEVADIAERTKEERLSRFGRPPKPKGEVGQVYSIRIPVARIAELEQVAAARGEAPRTMLREWVLERLEVEASGKRQGADGGRAKTRSTEKPSTRRRRAG